MWHLNYSVYLEHVHATTTFTVQCLVPTCVVWSLMFWVLIILSHTTMVRLNANLYKIVEAALLGAVVDAVVDDEWKPLLHNKMWNRFSRNNGLLALNNYHQVIALKNNLAKGIDHTRVWLGHNKNMLKTYMVGTVLMKNWRERTCP